MGFLQDAIDENPNLEQEIHIVDKFYVTVRWLTPQDRDNIAKAATEWKRGIPDVNRKKHAKAYAARATTSWRGLTIATLEGPLMMVVLDTQRAALEEIQRKNNGELPFSISDAATLYYQAEPAVYANPIKECQDEWEKAKQSEEADIEKK